MNKLTNRSNSTQDTEGPFGLRYAGAQGTVTLAQIAGGGRILLECEGRQWWSKPPNGAAWEAFETDAGQTYATKAEAEAVIANLTKAKAQQ